MRVRRWELINGASPCKRNFYPGGPVKLSDLRQPRSDEACPHRAHCPVFTSAAAGCVMRLGVEVAIVAMWNKRKVAEVVNEQVLPLLVDPTGADKPLYYLHSQDHRHFERIKATESKRILEAVRDFAVLVLYEDPPTRGAYEIPPQMPGRDRPAGEITIRRPDGRVLVWGRSTGRTRAGS